MTHLNPADVFVYCVLTVFLSLVIYVIIHSRLEENKNKDKNKKKK